MSSYTYMWIAYFGTDSETNMPFILSVLFESVFSISIILKLMTTFIEEGETQPETSHALIYQNYKDNGGMVADIIAWLPVVFALDCSKAFYFRLFYLIKCIRLEKALDKFDIAVIMHYIKSFTKT